MAIATREYIRLLSTTSYGERGSQEQRSHEQMERAQPHTVTIIPPHRSSNSLPLPQGERPDAQRTGEGAGGSVRSRRVEGSLILCVTLLTKTGSVSSNKTMRYWITSVCLILVGTFSVLADELPGFRLFRQIDRERRVTHQLETTALLAAIRVDPILLKNAVEKQREDARLMLGAAELAGNWTTKQEYYELALRAAGTNAVVALRYGLAAASLREFDTALKWLRFCEEKDKQNTAAWLAEVWVLKQQQKTFILHSAFAATKFNDYSVEATRARIAVLHEIGYSAYAARRIGVSADSPVMMMAQDLGRGMVSSEAKPVLLAAGKAMQKEPTFLLTELVGQSLESAFSQARMSAMEERRDDVKELVATTEQDAVEYATESEMVRYYDKMLSDGEEAAMKWLSQAVNRPPAPAQ